MKVKTQLPSLFCSWWVGVKPRPWGGEGWRWEWQERGACGLHHHVASGPGEAPFLEQLLAFDPCCISMSGPWNPLCCCQEKRWGFAGAALGWGVLFPEAVSVSLSHTLVNPFLLNQTQQILLFATRYYCTLSLDDYNSYCLSFPCLFFFHLKHDSGLIQSGRIGHALSSFHESTKITTSYWTTIDRRILKTTKRKKEEEEDTPHLKTRKELQWDSRRVTIKIKSNPILARWAIYKLENSNIREVLPLLWRSWAPCQASQSGDLAKGLGIPRESDFDWWPGGFDYRTAIGLGQTVSTLGGHKQKLVHTRTPEKGMVIPQATEPDPPASVGGTPVVV